MEFRRVLFRSLAMSLLTVALAWLGVLMLLGPDTPLVHLAIYAVILSTTSVAIVPAIQERRLADGAYGQTILSTALLADFITIIAISVLAGIVVSGGMAGASGSFLLVGATAAAIRSEEHTSELQSLVRNSYAVFCLN